MTTRTFLRLLGLFGLLIVGWGLFMVISQWQYIRIGSVYEVRRNRLTDQIQIHGADGQWRLPFENDPYATPLTPDDLKRVHIRDIVWGENGLLCARVLVEPGQPVRGRLAFLIGLRETKLHKRLRERALRATVDWPAGTFTPIVLRTGLPAPAEPNIATDIDLQPTSYSGS